MDVMLDEDEHMILCDQCGERPCVYRGAVCRVKDPEEIKLCCWLCGNRLRKLPAWTDAGLHPKRGPFTFVPTERGRDMPQLLLKGHRILMEMEDGAVFQIINSKDHIEIRCEEGPYNDAGHHTLHGNVMVIPQYSNSIQIRSYNR